MQIQEHHKLFLRTLLQNREIWKHDKKFAKIVKKMEKGKNLKKKEFAKVHWFIWNMGH